MRTFVLYGSLALAGCATPEAAFPDLANVSEPPGPASTSQQRDDLQREMVAEGKVAREAGQMVRNAEELYSELPKQPR